MSVRRGTTNGNERGNTTDRRRRRRWLLATFGDGVSCRCFSCEAVLTFETVTADRIVPGCEGGRYVQGNIRPSCGSCASAQGGQMSVERRAARLDTPPIRGVKSETQ